MAATDRPRRRIGLVAAGIGTLAGAAARAADNSLDMKFLHYGESDGRTTVENPELYFQHGFGQKGQLGLLLSYDAISGASPTGAAPTADATSSASGSTGQFPTAFYKDKRQAATLSYSRRFGSHLPSVALSYSHESDYVSNGLSLVDSWEFPNGRSTLHYGMGATSDKIDPVGTDDHFSKRSRSLVIGWTQVLGARDLCDISLGIDALSGYLTDPYKVVPVASAAGLVNVPEIRPDSRSRKSAIFKYGHYFLSRTALKTSYRYYWDDWSIKAHTLDLSLDQRMGRKLILTPRLRYYRQGNADFFAYEFSSPGAYMSSDYRVSSFWSWLAGVGLTVEVSDGWSFNLAGTYTDQTGLDRLQGTATAVAGPQLGVRRSSRILGEGEGEDGEDEGEGGSPSISPADMKVLSFTAGFSFKF